MPFQAGIIACTPRGSCRLRPGQRIEVAGRIHRHGFAGREAAIPGVAVGLPGGSTNLTFNGTSQFTANRVFADQIAATVVDLMPNGNLVIEGYRSRIVAGEERVLRFTGQVRQADIGVGNAVSSQAVANLRISYLGRGPATRATQGPIGRIANLVGPR